MFITFQFTIVTLLVAFREKLKRVPILALTALAIGEAGFLLINFLSLQDAYIFAARLYASMQSFIESEPDRAKYFISLQPYYSNREWAEADHWFINRLNLIHYTHSSVAVAILISLAKFASLKARLRNFIVQARRIGGPREWAKRFSRRSRSIDASVR